jgi:Zn-dependent protease with chaperone function
MQTELKGILHGAGRTASTTCDVIPRGTGLEIHLGDNETVVLDYVNMNVSLSGVDNRYMTFEAPHRGGAATLLVADRDIAARIEALGAPRRVVDMLQRAARSKRRHTLGRRAVLFALCLLLGLLALFSWIGFDWAVRRAVTAVPTEWETALGRSAARELLGQKSVCSDPELQRAVNEIGARLVGGLGSTSYRFTLRVLDDPDVNAFALPGGYVFVNRGLIEQAENGFEVAGVLSHEMQHVLLRHGLHNVARQAGLMMILRFVLGDAGAFEQFLMLNAAELVSMSFSRDQEAAADREGLELMYATSMDVSGLPIFLDKMAEKEGAGGELLGFISTHPGSRERAAALRALIEKRPTQRVTPLRFELSEVSDRCGPVRLSDPDGHL